MSVLSKLFGTEPQAPVAVGPVTNEHVELGWTYDQVRARYRQYQVQAVPLIKPSEDPTSSDDIVAANRASDSHKHSSLLVQGVQRWNTSPALIVTFNEKNMVMEVNWFNPDDINISNHDFSELQTALDTKFGTHTKIMDGATVLLTWNSDDATIQLGGAEVGGALSDFSLSYKFTGYDAKPS